jgi:hypothetical protein
MVRSGTLDELRTPNVNTNPARGARRSAAFGSLSGVAPPRSLEVVVEPNGAMLSELRREPPSPRRSSRSPVPEPGTTDHVAFISFASTEPSSCNRNVPLRRPSTPRTRVLRCWLNHPNGAIPGELRSLASMKPHDLEVPTGVVEFAAGDLICARQQDSRIVCWGEGAHGELGDGNTSEHAEPTAIQLPGELSIASSIPSRKESKPQNVCKDFIDCIFDTGIGVCRSRLHTDKVGQGIYMEPGPCCDCNTGSCEKKVLESVPCKTNADCWFSRGYPIRPIARPPRLRGTPFHPCEDGWGTEVVDLTGGWSASKRGAVCARKCAGAQGQAAIASNAFVSESTCSTCLDCRRYVRLALAN